MLPLLPSKRISRALSACIGGILLALCFPNFSLVPLLPVALIPLMAAVAGAAPRRAAFLGGLFGFVFWLGTLPWIAYTVHEYGGVSWPLAALALVLTALICLVPMALMTALVAAIAPSTPAGRIGTWAAAWAVQEGFRTTIYPFGGFPWALLGNPLVDVPPLIGTAALGGILFTSLLVAAVDAALLEALTDGRRERRLMWLAGTAALAVVAAFAGSLATRDGSATRGRLRVGIVQSNVSQETRWRPGGSEAIFQDLLAQTRMLSRVSHPELILWPESASPYQWSWSERTRRDVTALAKELDAAILLSTVWSDEPEREDAPFYNAALLVTGDGPVLPPYFKQRLVPFGEYVPLPALIGKIRPISRAVPSSFSPGERAGLIPFKGAMLGGAVCYEVVFPWVAREEVRRGAGLLFTLTNDSWYGTRGARRQHWQAARVRAVETGRTLVRAAVTGISGAADPAGRVIAEIGPDRKGAFALDVAVGGPPAPAVFAGDATLWVCAIGLGAAILRRRVPSPWARGSRESLPAAKRKPHE